MKLVRAAVAKIGGEGGDMFVNRLRGVRREVVVHADRFTGSLLFALNQQGVRRYAIGVRSLAHPATVFAKLHVPLLRLLLDPLAGLLVENGPLNFEDVPHLLAAVLFFRSGVHRSALVLTLDHSASRFCNALKIGFCAVNDLVKPISRAFYSGKAKEFLIRSVSLFSHFYSGSQAANTRRNSLDCVGSGINVGASNDGFVSLARVFHKKLITKTPSDFKTYVPNSFFRELF